MFFTQISQIARISPHGCARGGVCHTDCTDSTDFSVSRCLQGLARVSYSPCPAGRDLVDLVDYFPSGIFSGCGYFNLVDFLQGIAGCARWMGLSLTRVFLFACSLRSRNLGNLVDYFLRDSVRVRGWFKSCRFLYGIAGCARWIGLSLARGVLFACSLRSRNLVDLVDYFLRDSVRVRGWFKSCRFFLGIAGCARWIGLSLARVSYSPCPAGRDLVDLVDYFPSGIFSGCGYFNLVDFLQGIAGCARWIGLSLARVSYSPCPAGRDLVDLVDYFPSGIFSGCGYFNLVDFLQGIAGCARWIGLSLARVFLFACSLRSRNLVDLINLFLRDSVRVRGWFRSRRFL